MKFRRFNALILTVCMMISMIPAVHAQDASLDGIIADTAAYLQRAVPEPQIASIGGEWAVIGLRRSRADVPEAWYATYIENASRRLEETGGVLTRNKYSEYSRLVLALTALGVDPTDFGGHDILSNLADLSDIKKQGVNGPIFALLALDCGNFPARYDAQAKTPATRRALVDEILSRELPAGGFALAGTAIDPDLTGMALTALAPYRDDAAVAAVCVRALQALAQAQLPNGGFASEGSETCESAAQVVTALSALGIDCRTDTRFQKGADGERATPLDALLAFYTPGKGFCHIAGGGSDLMATEQALYALTAYQRLIDGEAALYDMTDTHIVRDASYADLTGHWAAAEVQALHGLGIAAGGAFLPDRAATRAEFAAALANAFGFSQKTLDPPAFSDVPDGAWYAPYVRAAAACGVVNGKGDGRFDPDGAVTREEAMTMLARTAALFGADVGQGEEALLKAFSDGESVSPWARGAAAYLLSRGLMRGKEDGRLAPADNITRAETAVFISRLLTELGRTSQY